MPAIWCACGETLDYGLIPNPIEWLAIGDVAYDAYVGQIDAEALYGQMKSILECPACGRLAAFWDGFGKPPKFYAPE